MKTIKGLFTLIYLIWQFLKIWYHEVILLLMSWSRVTARFLSACLNKSIFKMSDNLFIRRQFIKSCFVLIRFKYEILHMYYCNHFTPINRTRNIEQKIIQHFNVLKVVYMMKKFTWITNGNFKKLRLNVSRWNMKHVKQSETHNFWPQNKMNLPVKGVKQSKNLQWLSLRCYISD